MKKMEETFLARILKPSRDTCRGVAKYIAKTQTTWAWAHASAIRHCMVLVNTECSVGAATELKAGTSLLCWHNF